MPGGERRAVGRQVSSISASTPPVWCKPAISQFALKLVLSGVTWLRLLNVSDCCCCAGATPGRVVTSLFRALVPQRAALLEAQGPSVPKSGRLDG